MVRIGAGGSLAREAPGNLMPDNKDVVAPGEQDWLGAHEAHLDAQLFVALSMERREEVELLMRGISTGGFEVDLANFELQQDQRLWSTLSAMEQSELTLIERGESTKGYILDLDQLEVSLERS